MYYNNIIMRDDRSDISGRPDIIIMFIPKVGAAPVCCACIGNAMADRVALRRSIVSSLTCILGGDQSDRRSAEEELKTLEVTEGQSAPAQAMHACTMRSPCTKVIHTSTCTVIHADCACNEKLLAQTD